MGELAEFSLTENFRAVAILEEKIYQWKLRNKFGTGIGIRISFGFGLVLVSSPMGLFPKDLNALG